MSQLFGFPSGLSGGSKETSYDTTWSTDRSTLKNTNFTTQRSTSRTTNYTTNFSTDRTTFSHNTSASVSYDVPKSFIDYTLGFDGYSQQYYGEIAVAVSVNKNGDASGVSGRKLMVRITEGGWSTGSVYDYVDASVRYSHSDWMVGSMAHNGDYHLNQADTYLSQGDKTGAASQIIGIMVLNYGAKQWAMSYGAKAGLYEYGKGFKAPVGFQNQSITGSDDPPYDSLWFSARGNAATNQISNWDTNKFYEGGIMIYSTRHARCYTYSAWACTSAARYGDVYYFIMSNQYGYTWNGDNIQVYRTEDQPVDKLTTFTTDRTTNRTTTFNTDVGTNRDTSVTTTFPTTITTDHITYG